MMIPVESYLPILLMTINVMAAAVYGIKSNYWMSIYWIAAATLTFVVTFRPR
jgi:hypothetical protein